MPRADWVERLLRHMRFVLVRAGEGDIIPRPLKTYNLQNPSYGHLTMAVDPNTGQPVTAEDIGKRVEQFIKLRDRVKELKDQHKAELEPFTTAMDDLQAVFLSAMQTQNVDNMKTTFGTIYKSVKESASVSDMDAFWTYVVTQGAWDLLDKKANPKAVADHVNTQGAPPPGVNFSSVVVANCQRR